MPKHRLELLFRKCLDNSISSEEKAELHLMLNDPENADLVESYIGKILDELPGESLPAETRHSITTAITVADSTQREPVRLPLRNWKYAAAIIVLAAATLYFFRGNKQKEVAPAVAQTEDIAPGGNRATLTLADGTTILLDSASNATLAEQGSVQIIKLDDGQIAYRLGQSPAPDGQSLFNTISTPVGGQYQILLPDGSAVWLNAASSIRFPAVFDGQSSRVVELNGEAYFEVKSSASQPFIVRTGDVQIRVLGTAFNVMAYVNEADIRATLVNGLIHVAQPHGASTISPGQQARIANGKLSIIDEANLDEALAWKNGRFYFDNVDIQTVMRQIGRWYDVDIVFEGKPSDEKFEGEISRSSPLSEVLKILELTSVRFRLEGRKLTVLP